MLKILIPTDLSRDSAAGVRFALQLATQQKSKLIFFHVVNIPRLTRWNEEQYQSFRTKELNLRQARLEKWVAGIVFGTGLSANLQTCIIREGFSPETTLQEFCEANPEIDFVCMGTHGAAGWKRIWGTHTGNMITHSSIPVIVVPTGYRRKSIKHLLYASDLNHYEKELKRILPLVQRLKAEFHILHLVDHDEKVPDSRLFEKVLQHEFHMAFHIHAVVLDETRSMAINVDRFIHRSKPSLVILFTDQQRTSFEKIFFPSRTESLAFRTHTPLLAFPKDKAG
jgi:nucleotide-binding universal stress UspA family protein